MFLKKTQYDHMYYAILGIFLLFITLTPLFILCLYNHPSTFDDFVSFDSCKMGHNFSSVFHIGKRYATPPVSLGWNFSSPQPTLTEMQHMLVSYRLYAVFFILFFSFSFLFALKQCNTYFFKLAPGPFLLFYAALLFFVINCIKYFSYFFYDIILTAGYTYGICFILLFLGFFIKYYFAQKKNVYVIILFILTFIINGTIEYYAVLQGFILFVYFVSLWIKHKQKNVFVIALFFLSFLTAITYMFSSSVQDKLDGNLPGVKNPYELRNFALWGRNTFLFFLYNFFDYFSFKTLSILIPLSFVSAVSLNKNNYKIQVPYLFLAYFIIIVMSFSLFISGILDIRNKLSSVVIFNVILAINMIFICTYFLQRYCFPKCSAVFFNFIHKYDLNKSVKEIIEACKREIYPCRNMLFIIMSIITALYIGFIAIYDRGLPIRQVWKEIVKGSAAEYDMQISDIYKTLIEASEKNITIKAPDIISFSLMVDPIWLPMDYSGAPQSVHSCIAPFFNKDAIDIIIPNDID